MLSAHDVNQILATLSYKPLTTITAADDVYEGVKVRIVATVPDAFSDSSIDLGVDSYLSPNDRQDVQAFLRWLSWRLHRLESHESREFLRREGRPVFDPHAAA